MSRPISVLALIAAAGLAACGDSGPSGKTPEPAKVADSASQGSQAITPAPEPVSPLNIQPAAFTPPQGPASNLPPAGQAIAAAGMPGAPVAASAASAGKPASATVPAAKPAGYDPALLKLEVLLDRAGFSPGVIDGKGGENLDHAVAAYAQAHNLPAGVNKAVWDALAVDTAPPVQTYKITADDLAGPFIGPPPKDYRALSKLPRVGYADPQEMLAERFHMDRKLLLALNPKADFTKAGTEILVAAPRPRRDLQVARIEVDKSNEMVRAFDAADHLVAAYPATVGSTERPAPSGTFEVKAVAPNPAYFYDPTRLTFQPMGAKGKLRIAPGPNNPVGSTWIALSIPTYGIHGSPDPSLIGKRQSHGCVRLTNWDASELGHGVKAGVRVDFVGREPAKA